MRLVNAVDERVPSLVGFELGNIEEVMPESRRSELIEQNVHRFQQPRRPVYLQRANHQRKPPPRRDTAQVVYRKVDSEGFINKRR